MPDVAERTHLWQRAVKASGMDRSHFAIHRALMAEPLREVGAGEAWEHAPARRHRIVLSDVEDRLRPVTGQPARDGKS